MNDQHSRSKGVRRARIDKTLDFERPAKDKREIGEFVRRMFIVRPKSAPPHFWNVFATRVKYYARNEIAENATIARNERARTVPESKPISREITSRGKAPAKILILHIRGANVRQTPHTSGAVTRCNTLRKLPSVRDTRKLFIVQLFPSLRPRNQRAQIASWGNRSRDTRGNRE